MPAAVFVLILCVRISDPVFSLEIVDCLLYLLFVYTFEPKLILQFPVLHCHFANVHLSLAFNQHYSNCNRIRRTFQSAK